MGYPGALWLDTNPLNTKTKKEKKKENLKKKKFLCIYVFFFMSIDNVPQSIFILKSGQICLINCPKVGGLKNYFRKFAEMAILAIFLVP